MNPYVADPAHIPPTDLYADIPLYGRYLPKPNDFNVENQYINTKVPGSLEYWASVLSLCDESNRIYPADEGGRDVFALGRVLSNQATFMRRLRLTTHGPMIMRFAPVL